MLTLDIIKEREHKMIMERAAEQFAKHESLKFIEAPAPTSELGAAALRLFAFELKESYMDKLYEEYVNGFEVY